jgi:hypothetical protein
MNFLRKKHILDSKWTFLVSALCAMEATAVVKKNRSHL